jgi:predicted CXXCH cytochrome family protein
MDEFKTSLHWKRLAAGDGRAATCTSCHGVHGMLPHKDPRSSVYYRNVPETCGRCHNPQYMKGRNLPTDQLAKYRKSVHARAALEKGDPSAPVCNDCHGNHGARPPDVNDIALVCGTCHGREGELFAKSRVSHMLELDGRRGCVTCHGNHEILHPTDDMLTQDRDGLCHRCHAPGSPCDSAATAIVSGFNGMKGRIVHADSLLARADRLGMETDPGRELLKQASDALVQTRSALHGFDRQAIEAVIAEGAGFAARAEAAGREALRDWRNRRVGLALSLVVILALIGLLIAKIRQIERG